jgi:hypothetical protein
MKPRSARTRIGAGGRIVVPRDMRTAPGVAARRNVSEPHVPDASAILVPRLGEPAAGPASGSRSNEWQWP